MPDYLGSEQRKVKEEEKEDKPIRGIICEDFRVEFRLNELAVKLAFHD